MTQISDDERQRRIEAVGFGRANAELEGYVCTEAFERIDAEYISGAIDLAQYIAAYKAAAAPQSGA